MAANFYERLPPEDVFVLDRLAKLMIDLREGKQALLARHGVATAEELLERIKSNASPEHPAYEDYLGVRSIELSHDSVRTELRDYLLKVNAS